MPMRTISPIMCDIRVTLEQVFVALAWYEPKTGIRGCVMLPHGKTTRFAFN